MAIVPAIDCMLLFEPIVTRFATVPCRIVSGPLVALTVNVAWAGSIVVLAAGVSFTVKVLIWLLVLLLTVRLVTSEGN